MVGKVQREEGRLCSILKVFFPPDLLPIFALSERGVMAVCLCGSKACPLLPGGEQDEAAFSPPAV